MGSSIWSDHKGAILSTAMQAIPAIATRLLLAEESPELAVKPDYYRAIQQFQRALSVLQNQDRTVDWS